MIIVIESILPKEAEANEVSKEVTNEIKTSDGKILKILKKEEETFGGNNQKKKQKSKKIKNTVSLSLGTFQDFDKLKIQPPKKIEEIPNVLIQLEEKRVYYDTLPRDAEI